MLVKFVWVAVILVKNWMRPKPCIYWMFFRTREVILLIQRTYTAAEKEKKSLLNKIKELNKSQENLNNNIDKLKAPISYQNKKILKSAIITGSISLAIIACSIVACFFGAQYFLMTLGVSLGICIFNIMFSIYYFYYKYNVHSSLFY